MTVAREVSSVARDLDNRRKNVWAEAKAILEEAANENRDMTPEEQGRWEGRMGEIDKIDARLRGVLEAEQRSAAADDAFDAISRKIPDARVAAHLGSDGRDVGAEVRAFLKGDTGKRAMEFAHNPALGPINYRILQANTAAASA